MGWNISVYAERLVGDRYEIILDLDLFGWRRYDMFGFLGGFESEASIPPLAEERGIPPNSILYEPFRTGKGVGGTFGMSWLSVRELLDFDYDANFTGTFRIVEERDNCDFTYEYHSEAATEMTFRRFLGPSFFAELDRLAASGAERIIFFYA